MSGWMDISYECHWWAPTWEFARMSPCETSTPKHPCESIWMSANHLMHKNIVVVVFVVWLSQIMLCER